MLRPAARTELARSSREFQVHIHQLLLTNRSSLRLGAGDRCWPRPRCRSWSQRQLLNALITHSALPPNIFSLSAACLSSSRRSRPIHLYAPAEAAVPAAIGRISQAKRPPIGRTRPVASQIRALNLGGNLWQKQFFDPVLRCSESNNRKWGLRERESGASPLDRKIRRGRAFLI